MTIVTSSPYVMSETTLTTDHPIIGFRNVVEADAITTNNSDTNYPITNLANPATHLRWQGAANTPPTDQTITVTTGTTSPIDYVAIVKHNFGTGGITVQVDGSVAISPLSYQDLTAVTAPADDTPLLFRFTPTVLASVRVKLDVTATLPRAAVLYIGKLLVLPRKIWQDHTPIVFARKQTVANGQSEGGHYLGSVVLASWQEGRIKTSLIDPDDYRTDGIDDFLEAAVYERTPFFFGWRPNTYPAELGYCWAVGDSQPKNSMGHGLTEFDMQIAGIV